MLSSIIQKSVDAAFSLSLMQNVTDINYRLLFRILIYPDHVKEKKVEGPIGLNAFELISRPAITDLNLRNLFDLN